ncbi:hypothetical protein [Flavobacterium sp. PL02]|jgi:hypothetical protein|uniref:hypothetical protein n=1 Tax=Flavobacterium sp. PL02 TaxID=3088354 RepID=UPI002B23DBD7|nr:hypothetical protein [Flavobacterium sp. PL02]MEA9414475.1 hypothetical protein [Flavobacterium sp. PL02]
MELEELQRKGIEDFIFKKKINHQEEKLFIMRYQVLTRSISGLTESFLIDAKRLKELLLINYSKSYCKFYYIQKNGSLNLGLSFSDNEEELIQENDDILYALDNELFIKTDFKSFNSMIIDFKEGIGDKLVSQTGTESNMISYDFEIVDSYIKSLELHFTFNHLKFNMFQYRSTDLNGTSLPNFENKNDRISFCVHALVNDSENNKIFAESSGYDLGNLRP